MTTLPRDLQLLNIVTLALCLLISALLPLIANRKFSLTEWTFFSLITVPPVFVIAGLLHYKLQPPQNTTTLILSTAAVALVAAFIKTKKEISFNTPRVTPAVAALIAILAASALLRILLMYHTQYPLGDDTYFHCLYAKSILQNGKLIFTMSPYDPIPLKYPWGMHVALAFASDITAFPIHAIFKFSLIFWSVTSVLGIFVLARRLLSSTSAALWAALLYGLVANFGSIDYIRWGGLGNLLAMATLLALITSIVTPGSKPIPTALWQILLLATTFIIHGSASLVVFLILGVLAAILIITRKQTTAASTAIATIFISIIIGAITAPDILSHMTSLNTSAALAQERYVSVHDFPLMFNIALTAAALAGFLLIQRRSATTGSLLLISWNALLLLGFAASRYIFGLIAFIKTGQPSIAFLPSRFATDMIYPLSIFAGFATAWTFGKLSASRNKPASLATSTAILLLLLSVPIQHLQDKWGQQYAGPAETTAMLRLAKIAPPGSLVLNKRDAPGSYWVPYTTGIISTTVSRPMLYHLDYQHGAGAVKIVEYRLALNELLYNQKNFPLLQTMLSRIPAKAIFAYTDSPAAYPAAKLLFKEGRIFVYRIK